MSSVVKRAQRINWIDTAKGIGIILVTFGHIRNGNGQSVWLPALDSSIDAIYLFHMPLFFFLGGFTFSSRRSFGDFALRKAKTLLIPYYVFSLYFLAKPIAMLIVPKLGATLQTGYDSISLGQQFYNVLINGTGLWFLWAYFIGEIVVYAITKITHSHIAYVVIAIACIAVAQYVIVWHALPFTLPFQMVKGLEVAGWILLGLVTKRIFIQCKRTIAITGTAIAAIVFVLCAIPAVREVSWVKSIFTSQLFVQASTVAGVLACVFLAIVLQRSHVLEHIGRRSISFYALNAFTLNIGKLVFFKVLGIQVAQSSAIMQWIVGILVTVFCLALLWVEDWLIRKFIPWSIGLNISRTFNKQPAEI